MRRGRQERGDLRESGKRGQAYVQSGRYMRGDGGHARLVDAALGDRPEREHEPAVDGVVEQLRGADVERDERGGNAERAARGGERGAVRRRKFACQRKRTRVSHASRGRPERQSGRDVPPPRSPNVIVRRKNRMIRPMFLRRDATLEPPRTRAISAKQ